MDPAKLEILKVWYALFTTIMDANDIGTGAKLTNLMKLRERLAAESPELEAEIQKGVKLQ